MNSTNWARFTRRPRASARILGAAAVLLTAVTLTGCGRQARVRDVYDRPAVLENGLNASHATTHSAILRALNERGYIVESDDGRVVMARVSSGNVWALMRIEAGDGRYTITHADTSPQFHYDAKRGTVHRRYNRWVHNLAGTIDETLSKSAEIAESQVAGEASRQAKTVPATSEDAAQAASERREPAAAAPNDPAQGDAEASEPEAPAAPEAPPAHDPLPPRPPGAIDI